LSRDTTFAISEAQSKLDEIRNSNYDLITTDYISGGTPGNTFETTQPTGIGSIYINDSNPDLFEITIVICWRTKSGRIVGADLNLNGELDAGEPDDGDGILDSLATLITNIARRE